ncbi:hypothetical protein DAEQUDRAFT_771050 [Daedalea quercina L-15889]|uniref:Endonuclease/exonuclease/phosphatase domain-containing protein n=1 Tax=Daedalea quercina L-15889 TaxID=1314783 RepID=A0A165KE39_9APHY|nr:hypothetical protein DAEQUDRAFT_771050 [Daedalea quercina L-15889]
MTPPERPPDWCEALDGPLLPNQWEAIIDGTTFQQDGPLLPWQRTMLEHARNDIPSPFLRPSQVPEPESHDVQTDDVDYCIKFVSANVQKSAENTTQLLERYRDSDVICIQEPYWGRIKNVPSSKAKDGDAYEQTQSHRNFVCLGASEKSRTCTYVHKRWKGASPHINSRLPGHRDCLLVEIGTPRGLLNVLNVYNDNGRGNAIVHVLDHLHALTDISVMCGNFNLHHPARDRRTRKRSERAPHGANVRALWDLSTEAHLFLGNKVNGPPTWRSNAQGQPPRTLDLVWYHPDWEIEHLRLDPGP